MKNRSKALLLALCALMLVVTTVFTTLAYLTDSEDIVNTFTVGSVSITLTESNTDAYGKLTDGTNNTGNEYKLIPGGTYVKDPKVTVELGSEPSYVFVKIANGIAVIEDTEVDTIAEQIAANGWTPVDGETGVYVKTDIDARTEAKVLPVFGNVTLAGNAPVADYADAKIVITAYAIQKEGVADVATAWAALNA